MASKDCCSSELKSKKEKFFHETYDFFNVLQGISLMFGYCCIVAQVFKKKIPERLNSNASFLLSVHFPQAAPLMQLPIRAGDAPLHLRVLSG